jgi:hypothetical protein
MQAPASTPKLAPTRLPEAAVVLDVLIAASQLWCAETGRSHKDAGRPGLAWECTCLHARGATACGVEGGVRVRTSTGQDAGARPDALLFIVPMPDLAGREACPVRVQGTEKFTPGTRELDSLRDTMPKDRSNNLCTNTNLGCTMRFTGPTHPCTGASPSRDVPRAADSAYERRASALLRSRARHYLQDRSVAQKRRRVASGGLQASGLGKATESRHFEVADSAKTQTAVRQALRSRGNLFLLQKKGSTGLYVISYIHMSNIYGAHAPRTTPRTRTRYKLKKNLKKRTQHTRRQLVSRVVPHTPLPLPSLVSFPRRPYSGRTRWGRGSSVACTTTTRVWIVRVQDT